MKTADLDDAQVVRKVLRGQRALFGVILERYQRPIFNFIYRFYGNYDLAEELTQETFLRCYQFLKSYDPDRKFSTWLYTVAKNLCIDHYKKQRRGKEFSLDQALPSLERHEAMRSTETDPQIACIRSQEDARLLGALGELEPSRRDRRGPRSARQHGEDPHLPGEEGPPRKNERGAGESGGGRG